MNYIIFLQLLTHMTEIFLGDHSLGKGVGSTNHVQRPYLSIFLDHSLIQITIFII